MLCSSKRKDDWLNCMDLSEIVMKYWLDWIMGIFGTVSMFVLRMWYKRLKATDIRLKATELGVQALLRNEIIKSYNHFMTVKEIPIHERDNINKLYTEYKNLGGNGTITHLMEELEDLPVKRP